MSKKKAHHEEHVDESWLIPYADMLTLLLALFIVMFAMSKVEQEKFNEMKESFGTIFMGGAGLMEKEGDSMIPMEYSGDGEGETKTTTETSVSDVQTQINDLLSSSSSESAISGKVMEENQMNDLKEELEKEIETLGYSDLVKVVLREDGLDIMIQDLILFKGGDATVTNEVSELLIQIAKMLVSLDNHIKIVGHTDNLPINNGKYRSNWDLSAMRAINVMNYMVEKGGLKPEKLSIMAYGEYMPIADNKTIEGRAQNRRVEIMIVRNYQ